MNAERGNAKHGTKHGPKLDDEMAQESRGMVQGHGRPHAEPFRETEPRPDDTDPDDVVDVFEVGSVGVKRPSDDKPPTPTREDVKRLGDDEGEGRRGRGSE